MKRFLITKEYITLGQLLKNIGVISSGGEAKYFLNQNEVYVNNELENRRGRKIYKKDRISFNTEIYEIE